MNNSQITVRVSDPVKVLWKQMADKDGRSMSNYLERLLLREKDRMENGSETLDTLGDKINNLIEIISENKKRGTKNSEVKDKKLTAYDAWELVNGEEICTRENWNKWITHLHKLGMHLTPYAGGLQFNNLKDIWYEDKDCDLIINHIIKQGHKKLYIPKS